MDGQNRSPLGPSGADPACSPSGTLTPFSAAITVANKRKLRRLGGKTVPVADRTAEEAVTQPLEKLRQICKQMAEADSKDFQKIASLIHEMILDYYQDVRKQAQQSFISALVAAAVGTALFIYAAWLEMRMFSSQSAAISVISGSLIQVISCINFYLYSKAARQFAAFHICLERTYRFVLANTLCENIQDCQHRDEVRIELIEAVMSAPMLTGDLIAKSRSTKPKAKSVPAPSKQPEVRVTHAAN
jgi:hypothetical protein